MAKILLVDDEKNIVRVLETRLKASGYEVITTYNAEETLEKVKTESPSLIILDIIMPGMNGYEVCLLLKRNEKTRDIPVIMLSVKAQAGDEALAVKAGASYYITKPYEAEKLLSIITRSLGVPETKKTEELGGLMARFQEDAKEIEEKIKATEQAYKELERVNEIKSRTIANISHELRTPLTSIVEAVSLIKDGTLGDITEDQKEFLLIIEDECMHLTHLISNILDISHIEAGRTKLKKNMIDIFSIVEERFKSFHLKAKKKNITLRSAFPSNNFPHVYADPSRIRQIFNNLIENAIKFTPEEGEVSVEGKDMQDHLEFSVIDTGIGIPPETRDKAFKRLNHACNSSLSGASGTGLGLAITKELVEMHNGRIWVDSEPGKGSTFTFTLPKGKPNSEAKEYREG